MTTYPNWFHHVGAHLNFDRLLTGMPEHPRFLQVGAFVGHASEWLLSRFPTATLFDVDTWQGSAEGEHERFDWADVEAAYDERVAPFAGRVVKCPMTSDRFFANVATGPFDFVYVDGSHEAGQVLKDAVNAIEVMAPGGVLAFDDYTWGLRLPTWQRPHDAINSFLDLYRGRYEVLERGLQVWLRWNA